MFQSLSPARRRLYLSLLGAVAAVALLVGYLLLRGEPTTTPVAQDKPGPVLLVPGYGGNTAGLSGLADRLTAAGRDAEVVPLPGGGTGDLRAQAATLDAAAQAALKRTGAESVDVIGYSAGGVVARIWVGELGGGNVARRVITLGAPHHGTQIAALAIDLAPSSCPEACQQLAPDSDLMTELNAGDETPDGPEFVSVWTDQDQTVTPPDTASLDGAVNVVVQDVCSEATVSHGELPTDQIVTGIVLAELGAGPPVDLGPEDCATVSS